MGKTGLKIPDQLTTPSMPEVKQPIKVATIQEQNHERMVKLEEIIGPIVEFMNEHCCPHDLLVIEQGSVRLYQGACGFPTEFPE